jgi:hypothetical protein
MDDTMVEEDEQVEVEIPNEKIVQPPPPSRNAMI